MPRLGAERIGKGPVRFQFEAYEKEVKHYFNRHIKPEIRKGLEKQVENFDRKPRFVVRITVGRNPTLDSGYGITLDAWATGPYAELWKMLSRGADEHMIYPRGDHDLWYWKGYSPKTEVIDDKALATNVGDGSYAGPLIRAPGVRHPGFDPRRWTYYLMEEYRPVWRSHIDALLREAMRAARRMR